MSPLRCNSYIGQFGGPIADKKNAKLRARTYTDLMDIFTSLDTDNSGYIDEKELEAAAVRLRTHTRTHTRTPRPTPPHSVPVVPSPHNIPCGDAPIVQVKLGFPFKNKAELKATFTQIDKDGNGRITDTEFIEWWNKNSMDDFGKKLHKQLTMTAENEVAIDKLLYADDKRKQ